MYSAISTYCSRLSLLVTVFITGELMINYAMAELCAICMRYFFRVTVY